tara:strand:+ start:1021 stop:1257 length:237 start_codon:yes stop_codon:yes gene_type:complete
MKLDNKLYNLEQNNFQYNSQKNFDILFENTLIFALTTIIDKLKNQYEYFFNIYHESIMEVLTPDNIHMLKTPHHLRRN